MDAAYPASSPNTLFHVKQSRRRALPPVYTISMGTFVWWWKAEWRRGPWGWLALCCPALLFGASLLPDPVGGSEGPRSYFDGLAKVLMIVGWTVRMARNERDLPTWPQAPWGAVGARLVCSALAPLAMLIPGLSALWLLSGTEALAGALSGVASWALQLAPWVTLSTLVIPRAMGACFLVLLPFVADWMSPRLVGGPFQGLLPDGAPPESIEDLVRRSAAAVLVAAVAAAYARRRSAPGEVSVR